MLYILLMVIIGLSLSCWSTHSFYFTLDNQTNTQVKVTMKSDEITYELEPYNAVTDDFGGKNEDCYWKLWIKVDEEYIEYGTGYVKTDAKKTFAIYYNEETGDYAYEWRKD